MFCQPLVELNVNSSAFLRCKVLSADELSAVGAKSLRQVGVVSKELEAICQGIGIPGRE
jgi:hypothetical protein